MKFIRFTLAALTLLFLAQCSVSMGPSISKLDYAPGNTSSGWIKTKIIKGNVFIPVTVNGHRVLAMLDSGTQRTTIPANLAKSFGVHTNGHLTVQSYGGNVRSSFGTKIDVKIGAMNYELFRPAVEPMVVQIRQEFPFKFIILGEDVFLKDVIEFDFSKQQLRFAPPAPTGVKKSPADSLSSLIMINKTLTIPGSITGGPTGYFEIDTGDANICALYKNNSKIKKWLKIHPNLTERPFKTVTVIGGGGAYQTTLIRIKQMKMLGANFNKFPCSVTNAPTNDPRVIGSIGLSLMRIFNATFDYPARKIYFKPELKSGSQMPD